MHFVERLFPSWSLATRCDTPSGLVRPFDIPTCAASISPWFASCMRVGARLCEVSVVCLYAFLVTSYIAPRPKFSYSAGWY